MISLFIEESVYLVLNSLYEWEPVEKLKQRCDITVLVGWAENIKILTYVFLIWSEGIYYSHFK